MTQSPARFHPLALRVDQRIDRPRLTRWFGIRFERKLSLVTAPAGYGKSTALAQAIASNLLDPVGTDVWLAAVDADADPAHLLAGITIALGLEPTIDIDQAIEVVANHLWAQAPTDVALIIDDVHLITSHESVAALQRLIAALPANGHLLLAGRVMPTLQLARLRALHDVAELDHRELALDDQELAELVRHRSRDQKTTAGPETRVELPRLAALADLQLVAGSGASTDYLWEEVLDDLPEARLDGLTRACVFDYLDDEMVGMVTEHRFTTQQLVAGLPMVEEGDDNRHRLHSLLRQALLDRIDQEEARALARSAAEFELERGRLDVAARLLVDAGEQARAIDVAHQFAMLPLLRASLSEVRAVAQLIKGIDPTSLVVELLDAQGDYGRYEAERVERFIALARRARADGDDLIEAIAIFRSLQGAWQRDIPEPDDITRRIRALAASHDFARGVVAMMESARAQFRGEPEVALAAIEGFTAFDEDAQMVMRAERLCDLGLVDEVGVGLEAADLESLPPGVEVFVAFGMWLRGEALPEIALQFVSDMIPTTLVRSHLHAAISVLGVGTHIALAAGAFDVAGSWADRAAELSTPEAGVRVRVFAMMATSAVAAVDDGDEAGAEKLGDALAELPAGDWPARAHFLCLPLLYLLRPETRPSLDVCRFGPSISVAIQAGQALVALRDEGRASEALLLPWDNEALLRVHVLPPYLVELGTAAAEAGNEEARGVVRRTPELRRWLERISQRPPQPGRVWAQAELDSLPVPPPARLRIRALGPLEISSAEVADQSGPWRRARVRELLAYLIEHRSVMRIDLARQLWPDLDESKALANLRVNLTHLNKALEPDRKADTPSAYLVTDGDRLSLSEHVDLDVDDFDRLMAKAREHDQGGAPAEALAWYRQALALVNGSYLDGVGGDWAYATGVRLASATLVALCRVGELTLAKGEPEQALALAVRAHHQSALDERAARLLISCLVATGDRVAALDAADKLYGSLDEAGLEPELATEQLLARLRQRG